MFTRSASVTIARPVAEVFDFISDARNRPSWDPGVESEELTSPEPIGVGSTVRTTMRSMGRELEIDWEVIEHQAPTRQTVESTSGPFPTTLVWALTEEGGSTRAEFTITGDPAGGMRLMQPLIARGTQSNLDRAFPRLKRLLETGSAEADPQAGPG
jgi:carbon monoxide dehydrogenase subunit G